MNRETNTADRTDHEKIAEFAYQLWDKAGRQEGRDLEYWLKAEKQSQFQGEREPAMQRVFKR